MVLLLTNTLTFKYAPLPFVDRDKVKAHLRLESWSIVFSINSRVSDIDHATTLHYFIKKNQLVGCKASASLRSSTLSISNMTLPNTIVAAAK